MNKILIAVSMLLLSITCSAQVVAKATAHSVTLTWTASTTTGVTGYNIYRGTTAGGENYTTPLNSALVTGTTYVDTTVSPLTTYYYTAEAYCPTCTPNSSVPSNEVSAAVPGNPQPSPPVLNTPTAQ